MKKFRKKLLGFLSVFGLTASCCVANIFAYELKDNVFITENLSQADSGFHYNSWGACEVNNYIELSSGEYTIGCRFFRSNDLGITQTNYTHFKFGVCVGSTPGAVNIFDSGVQSLIYDDFTFGKSYNLNFSVASGKAYLFYFMHCDDNSLSITTEKLNYAIYSYNSNGSIKSPNFYLKEYETISDFPSSLDKLFINNDLYNNVSMANGFNYWDAYNDGFSVGSLNASNNSYYEGYTKAINEYNSNVFNDSASYVAGVNYGRATANTDINIAETFFSVFDAPVEFFKKMFDIDLFGYNLADTFIGIVAVCVFVWLLKFFL